jgi:hypothetical protein
VQKRLRRLGASAAVVVGIASTVITAAPASAATCTGQRVLSITGGRVVEGSARTGFTTLNFTVASTGCAQAGTVRFQTGLGTADKDDFVAKTASLTYRAGETASRTVPIQVVPDYRIEPRQCPSGTLAVPSPNFRLAVATALATILDDDLAGTARDFMCSE